MITKTILAAAAVAAVAATAAAPAQAKVNVYLGIGGYGPGYIEPEYPIYDAPPPPPYVVHHHRPVYEEEYVPRPVSYGVSCEEGIDVVRAAGFRHVQALNCSGKRYKYVGRRYGDSFIVKVSHNSGNIISVEQTW